MRRAVVLLGVSGLLGNTHAGPSPDREPADPRDDHGPAYEHAARSTTLYLASPWSPDPTVPIRGGAEAALRVHRRGYAVEARLGAGGAGSVVGLSGHFTGHAGASVGGAIPIGGHVVLAPMLAYDAFFEWEHRGADFVVHYITIELPVSIVFDRGVVLELLLQGGVAHYNDATDPAIIVGPRIGYVF